MNTFASASHPRAPEVSVVMPVYNGERHLRAALQSVLDQTHENFEILVCDDASGDNSRAILAEYEDSRLRVHLSERNRGLFPTLNFLIENARGRLIKLWTQDDIMRPFCLQTMADFANAHPEVGMIYSNRSLIDENTRLLKLTIPDTTPSVITPDLAARIMFYHGSIAGNISNVMIPRRTFETLGPFREEMIVAGDFEMWERIATRFPLGFLNEPLIYLRDHAEQFSRRVDVRHTFLREEIPIYAALLQRLPADEHERARRFHRRQWGRRYAHVMMRALLAGRFRAALGFYRTLATIESPLHLVALWLLTVNGRFFKLPSGYVPPPKANARAKTS